MIKTALAVTFYVFVVAATSLGLYLETHRGPVHFPHALHESMIGCGMCHENGALILYLNPDFMIKNPTYKPTLHDLCLQCHFRIGNQMVFKDVPPKKCESCHGYEI